MSKKILKIGLLIVIAINIVACFHAYKFTHFDSTSKNRTNDPNKLSAIDKILTLVLGVSNPRPINIERPDTIYKTIKVSLNKDTIECWDIHVQQAKGTVILFHGYAANKSILIEKSKVFNRLGYNTVLVDFLGSGGSTGNKTTIGFGESKQVKTIYDHFKIHDDNIILFGTSMGSVAIMKAINDYQIKPKSIIIECPFGNMLKTVQSRFRIMKAPIFPMSYLLVFWGGIENGFNAFKHNPSEYAKNINVNTLLLYGLKDNKVSLEEINLIKSNLNGKSELKIYKESGHEDLYESHKLLWAKDVAIFLNN